MERFSQHPVLSRLSLVEINALLHQFKSNPLYDYFVQLLQAEADRGMRLVTSGFQSRDVVAILEREQIIGAAPSYLRFGQMVDTLSQELQTQIKEQDERN